MNISELINKLNYYQRAHGDLEVVCALDDDYINHPSEPKVVYNGVKILISDSFASI